MSDYPLPKHQKKLELSQTIWYPMFLQCQSGDMDQIYNVNNIYYPLIKTKGITLPSDRNLWSELPGIMNATILVDTSRFNNTIHLGDQITNNYMKKGISALIEISNKELWENIVDVDITIIFFDMLI